MRTFGSYKKDFATFSGNSSTTANSTNSYDNISWGMRMINDSIRYLATIFYFNEDTYVVPGGTVANQQGYTLPSDFEQIMNVTVQVGGILYQPKESPSRKHFDALNVIQFYNDFPQFYYIYNGKLLLYPTPASSSNVMTINYKRRIIDLSMDDKTDAITSQTLSINNGTATLTASGSVFKQWMLPNGWVSLNPSETDAANGDGRWYQLSAIASTTSATIKNNYMGPNATGASFTIGNVPILPEDYQDLPLYRALSLYYTARVPDPVRAAAFDAKYNEGYTLLDNKYGSKSNSPVLTDMEAPVWNPNLFPRNLTQA